LSHEKKNGSRIHKECLNNFFGPIFLPQTPYVLMCIKCMNVTKTKCPIVMSKVSKSQISKNFKPLIEHGPHWINFSILTFISENSRYFRGLYKIWNKIISFDMRKKG
jgi:hypothetical protein